MGDHMDLFSYRFYMEAVLSYIALYSHINVFAANILIDKKTQFQHKRTEFPFSRQFVNRCPDIIGICHVVLHMSRFCLSEIRNKFA